MGHYHVFESLVCVCGALLASSPGRGVPGALHDLLIPAGLAIRSTLENDCHPGLHRDLPSYRVTLDTAVMRLSASKTTFGRHFVLAGRSPVLTFDRHLKIGHALKVLVRSKCFYVRKKNIGKLWDPCLWVGVMSLIIALVFTDSVICGFSYSWCFSCREIPGYCFYSFG